MWKAAAVGISLRGSLIRANGPLWDVLRRKKIV